MKKTSSQKIIFIMALVSILTLMYCPVLKAAGKTEPPFQIKYQTEYGVKEIVIYKGYYANPLIVRTSGMTNYLGKIDFSVADPKIASVDKDGRIKALSVGTTTYKAALKNRKNTYVECKIRVINRPKGINAAKVYAPNETIEIWNDYGSTNMATSPNYYLYVDSKNNLNVVSVLRVPDGFINDVQQFRASELVIHTYNKKYKLVKSRKVPMPYKKFGGFYEGEDGNFYVAVGDNNKEKNNDKVVLCILKYNSSWKETGRCEIKADAGRNRYSVTPDDSMNIQDIFYSSNCSMALKDNMLVVHTGRQIYSDDHQGSVTFKIDTRTMEQIDKENDSGSYYTASHSFRQFAAFDKGNLVLIDQSDGFPERGTLIQTHMDVFHTYNQYPVNQHITFLNAMPYSGSFGQNQTGVEINGFETGKYNNITAGASISHDDLSRNPKGRLFDRNVYALLSSKDGTSAKTIWLTDFREGSGYEIWGTKLIKLSEDKFIIVYSKHKSSYAGSDYAVIDSKGRILERGRLSEDIAHNGCKPVLFNGKYVWMVENNSGGTEGIMYGDKTTNYFYELQVK